jgi:hypothetical protein
MEALGGSLVLANSLVSGEHEDSGTFGVIDGEDTDADVVADYSSEMDVQMQTLDVPPGLDGVLPEMVIQGVEKQAKVVDSVHLGNTVELNEKPDSPLAINGVPPSPAASALLEEYLTSFRRTEPLSLLDASILVQLEGDSTYVGRGSGRLKKKNKDCSIPTAKRAEHRLLEAFGDLPKKGVMPATAQAVRELVKVNG